MGCSFPSVRERQSAKAIFGKDAKGYTMMDRRMILKRASVTGAFVALPVLHVNGNPRPTRKFTIDLTPGAIGVKVKPEEIIGFAKSQGFESVQPNASFLGNIDSARRKEFRNELAEGNRVILFKGVPSRFGTGSLRDIHGFRIVVDHFGISRG